MTAITDKQWPVAMQRTRELMRVLGPRTDIWKDAHRPFVRNPDEMHVFRCLECEELAKPEMTSCPVCDYEVPVTSKWLMTMHLNTNPKWCQDKGRAKVKAWGKLS